MYIDEMSWLGARLDQLYGDFQTQLLQYFPGQHELQTRTLRYNPEHSFVIGNALHIRCASDGSAALTGSLRRVRGSVQQALDGARLTGCRFAVLPLKLAHPELGPHANMLVLVLGGGVERGGARMLWFEPHGADPQALGHPRTFAGYYSAAALSHVLRLVIAPLHVELVTPAALGLPPVWGQSRSADSMCALWCLLFVYRVLRGIQLDWIVAIARLSPREINQHVTLSLKCARIHMQALMRGNQVMQL